MVEPFIVITNNEMSMGKMGNQHNVVFIDGKLLDVLKKVRDYVHKGHRLLTHPLMGSIKPNDTPFKTVLISAHVDKTIDIQSLQLIESSIHTTEKLLKSRAPRIWPERMLEDFRLIDFDLIYNVIN